MDFAKTVPLADLALEEMLQAWQKGCLSRQDLSVQLCEHACSLLECHLASVWTLEFHAGGSRLQRLGGFDAGSDRVLLRPLVLEGDTVNRYLGGLRGGAYGEVDAGPARGRLGSMLPPAVGLLLDAVVGTEGAILALLCCERHEERCAWSSSETRLAQALAHELSTAVAQARDEGRLHQLVASAHVLPPVSHLFSR